MRDRTITLTAVEAGLLLSVLDYTTGNIANEDVALLAGTIRRQIFGNGVVHAGDLEDDGCPTCGAEAGYPCGHLMHDVGPS